MFLDIMWTSDELYQKTVMATSPLKKYSRNKQVKLEDHSNTILEEVYIKIF